MYNIRYDNNSDLYFPGDREYSLVEAKLSQKVGSSGELNITMASDNPLTNIVAERKLVTIYKNDKEYWRGDIRESHSNFLNQKSLVCIEDLAFLGEVIKFAHSVEMTYEQYFQMLLAEYNSKVNSERQFDIGYITKTPGKSRKFTYDTQSYLELLRAIADDYYVRVRRTDGKRYIDIVSLEEYGKSNNQPIVFGENLNDFVKETNTSWLLTAILPLGEELETETIPGITDRVTIESVNEGSKVLVNQTAVERYGYIEKIIEFSSTSNPESLKSQAEGYLARNAQPRISMEVKAVDLSWVENVDSYELGDLIPIKSEPYGIDQNISLCELGTNILDPTDNDLTLSSTVARRSFTDIQNDIAAEIEELPSKSEILNASKNNMLKILNGNDGGYVSFITNEEKTAIEEIVITDQPTIEASIKMWKWNLSGLGYMYRSTPGDEAIYPWTDLGVAMTMDGSIVASFITAGTLKLAGDGSEASLEVYSGKTLIGKWDSNGIQILKGSLNINNGVFRVDADGKVTCTNADIKGKIQATSGYIGNGAAGWQIGNSAIYNGCTGLDSTTPGVYLGTDGIRMQYGLSYSRIKNGMFISNVAVTAKGFIDSSDMRLKEKIKPLKNVKEFFRKINPITFHYNQASLLDTKDTNFGVLAQEMEQLLREEGYRENSIVKVMEDGRGFLGVNYPQLIAWCIAGIKELYEEIDNIKKGDK